MIVVDTRGEVNPKETKAQLTTTAGVLDMRGFDQMASDCPSDKVTDEDVEKAQKAQNKAQCGRGRKSGGL